MSDFFEMMNHLKHWQTDPDNEFRRKGGGYLTPARLFHALAEQPTLYPGVIQCVRACIQQSLTFAANLQAKEQERGNRDGWGLLYQSPPPDKFGFVQDELDWPDLLAVRVELDVDFDGEAQIELRSQAVTRCAFQQSALAGKPGFALHWPDRDDLDETFWPPRAWAEAVVLCHFIALLKSFGDRRHGQPD